MTRKTSFLREQIIEYTVLEIQFRSINYMLVARNAKIPSKTSRAGSDVQVKNSIY